MEQQKIMYGIHSIKDIPLFLIGGSNNNVIIQTCSFLYSMGPLIKLKSGYVNITNCALANSSTHYTGHGSIIYYSSGKAFNVLTIENCDFSSISSAKSIIYINQGIRTANAKHWCRK